jgi:hypothetical protein
MSRLGRAAAAGPGGGSMSGWAGRLRLGQPDFFISFNYYLVNSQQFNL